MLSFQAPLTLLIGCAAIGVVNMVVRLRRRKGSLPLPLGAPGGESFDPPVRADILVTASRVAELVGALLLAAAAAGPLSVSFETLWLQRGADVLFVLDASPSMSAKDYGDLSRFDTAKELVKAFARSRPADAIGLVALGADASLLVPPTQDRAVLEDRLSTLKIAELGDGTALGLGLAVAAFHLRGSKANRAAVVLITDGENNAGPVHPDTVATLLGESGVSLYVVGIGSPGSVPIDYVDPSTGAHRSGLMESRYDPEKLQSIAKAGSGVFLSAPTQLALSAAFSKVDDGVNVVVSSMPRRKEVSLSIPFALAGLVLFSCGRFIRRGVLGALL